MPLPSKIHLEVVTPTKMGLHLDVSSIIAPGTDGYIGILPGHTFLITSLREGTLQVRFDDRSHQVLVGEGYMEVSPEQVVVVTEYMKGIGESDEHIRTWGIKYEEKM
jgi:F-type H+-transporting ATPase subunit epsilon